MIFVSLLKQNDFILNYILLILRSCIETQCAQNNDTHFNSTEHKMKKPALYFKVAWWNYSGDDMDTFKDIFKHVDGRSESFYDDLSVSLLWILLAILFSLCVIWVLIKCFKLTSLSKVDLWVWCDGWFDCRNKNKIEDPYLRLVDFDLFKQNLKSFGFVCAVRMANLSTHHERELIFRFKYGEIERNMFLENYQKVNLEYAIEASPSLNEMCKRVPELWYMLILGWKDLCYNLSSYENQTNEKEVNINITCLAENNSLENVLVEMDGLTGIPIAKMQPEQMSIKKLNAFRLCIILDTFFRLRLMKFEECEIPKQSTFKGNLISRRCSDDIKVEFPLNNVCNKVKSSSFQSITKFNDSNGTTTTAIFEEKSLCEHSSTTNIEIKYARNIPAHVQSLIVDIATNGCLKFPEDDISCSYHIEKHLKTIKFFDFQLGQPIICVKKVEIMKLFDHPMESFKEFNQILYFTLFDRGCIVINELNNQAKYLEKLLSMASRERLTKSMNFSWEGVTYVWKFLPMSAHDSRISKNDFKSRHAPTLFVSYRGS